MMRVAFAWLVLFLVPSTAWSQVNTLVADNPREEAAVKAGPFYVSPRIQLTELGVDTNVFNASGEQKSDFTATVTPSANVWVPIARRGLIKATVSPDLVWYQRYSSERSLDPAFTLRGEAYLRRFTIFAEDSFLHSRQRPSFEIDVRSRRTENRFTAGVDIRLTPKISLEVHGTRSETEFDGDTEYFGTRLAEVLNRRSTGFAGIARYRPTVLTAIALRAERFEDRFPLSPERGSDNVRVMPGFEFQPRALVHGSAYVGVRHLNPVDELLLPEFSGLVSDLTLGSTFLGSTALTVTHTRDIRYSFEPLQPYYVATGAGLSARRAIGARFDVIANTTRYTNSYRDLIVETTAPERVDTIWNYGANLGYRLGRNGRVGVGVTYWRRNSTTRQARDYDGLHIGTTASYGF
jgi:hypothetical protein